MFLKKSNSLPNIKKALKKHKTYFQDHDINKLNSFSAQDSVKIDITRTDVNQRIIINSRGIKYDVFLYIFEKLPDSRLGKLKEILEDLINDDSMDTNELLDVCDAFNMEKFEFYFNRDPYILNIILNYYINDKLHVNDNICVCLLTDELKYWRIDEYLISSCCQNKYFEKTDQINDDIVIENKEKKKLNHSKEEFKSCLPKIKESVWNLLEKPRSSKLARVKKYFFILLWALHIYFYSVINLLR
jgi:hypothetical protein